MFVRYANVINVFGREFELEIQASTQRGDARVEESEPDVIPKITLDRTFLFETLDQLLEKPKYRLRSIPRHVWAELVIGSIYNNFEQKETLKDVVGYIYSSYFGRPPLADSSRGVERFELEHERFLRRRYRSRHVVNYGVPSDI